MSNVGVGNVIVTTDWYYLWSLKKLENMTWNIVGREKEGIPMEYNGTVIHQDRG